MAVSTFLAILAVVGTADQAQLDSAVLRTVGDACFDTKAHWAPSNWRKGDYVAFQSNYTEKSRSDYQSTIENGISGWTKDLQFIDEAMKRPDREEQDLKKERAFAISCLAMLDRLQGPSASAAAIIPLKSLALGDKIVVADVKRNHLGPIKVKGPNGKLVEPRAVLSLRSPGYSLDGRYAVVEGWFPWSIHHAEITYFLEKSGAEWKVLCARTIYFV